MHTPTTSFTEYSLLKQKLTYDLFFNPNIILFPIVWYYSCLLLFFIHFFFKHIKPQKATNPPLLFFSELKMPASILWRKKCVKAGLF